MTDEQQEEKTNRSSADDWLLISWFALICLGLVVTRYFYIVFADGGPISEFTLAFAFIIILDEGLPFLLFFVLPGLALLAVVSFLKR